MSKYGVAACPTSSRLRGSLIKDSSEIYVMLGEREKVIKVVKFDWCDLLLSYVLVVRSGFYLLATLLLYIFARVDSRRIYLVVACVIFGVIDRCLLIVDLIGWSQSLDVSEHLDSVVEQLSSLSTTVSTIENIYGSERRTFKRNEIIKRKRVKRSISL